jgi:hypothetical protein
MSISTSLHRAAQLQEKIDELRGQLATLLDRARSEISSAAAAEVSTAGRSKGPGRRKARRGQRKVPAATKALAMPVKRGRTPAKLDGRSKAARALRGGKGRSPLAGRKRLASPSGPLAPAVVKVLKQKGGSMSVRDILDDLLSSGYKFNTPEPKKNLAARIYRLKGVKQVAQGLFATA